MFPKTVFTAKLGADCGRIAPSGFVPTEGTYAFVLGSDDGGVFQNLSVGDFTEVTQYTDLLTSNPTYVRARFKFRPPPDMPAGVFWRFTFFTVGSGVEPTARVTYDLVDVNDHESEHGDFAIPLRGVVAGTRLRVGCRIELAGTAGDYEVELPGIYTDSWVLDTLEARPTPINRVPEPDETGVRVNAPIIVEINDPDVTGIPGGSFDLTKTRVMVSGHLAYDGNAGGFQTGYDGPDSAVDATMDDGSPSRPRTVRITIDPTTSFAPLTVIPVAVHTGVRTQPEVDFTYSFTTEDLVAPLITSAQAIDRRVVRVTLSEFVVSDDPTASNDALNIENWSIVVASTSLADGLPAVTPSVLSVAEVTSNIFDLTFDMEMTPSALYLVEAGAIEDLFGNAFVAPNNRAYFNGYVCTGPDGREFDLLEFLPAMNVNEDETEDLHKFVACLQETTDILLCDVDHWTDILDPDVAPERFVDAMLADLGNPFDFDLNEVDKRRLIRVLVPIYEQKGTDPGIINAVRFFLGLEVTIGVPAFEDIWILGVDELGIGSLLGSSDLHDRLSFVVVSGIVLTDDQRDKITKIVEYMKDARTHFIGFVEPTAPPAIPDHWELGLSELGESTLLH